MTAFDKAWSVVKEDRCSECGLSSPSYGDKCKHCHQAEERACKGCGEHKQHQMQRVVRSSGPPVKEDWYCSECYEDVPLEDFE